MLREVREALAAAIEDGANYRVAKQPPRAPEMPSNGDLYVYIQPDPDSYVAPWMTFSVNGRAEVRYQVVVCCPDDGNQERAWERLDDAIDPMSTAPNVFGALLTDQGQPLPLTVDDSTQATAAPLLEPVAAPRLVVEADGQFTYYELILPVQVIVQRS